MDRVPGGLEEATIRDLLVKVIGSRGRRYQSLEPSIMRRSEMLTSCNDSRVRVVSARMIGKRLQKT